MTQSNSSEKGQILIMLVLVVIGLLGFTALAIDGGMIFADRRYTQSAADAASLAGAGAAAEVVQENDVGPVSWNCGSGALQSSISAAISAAIASAGFNDYVIAYDNALGNPGHDHGVKVTCNNSGEYLDVEVMLSRVTNTSFAHLFTGGVMRNTVHSITRVKPQIKAGNGATIVGMGMECEKQEGGGVHFDSGSLVTVLSGGGVYSNDCVTMKNNADVTVTGGNVTCHVGTTCETENMNMDGPTYMDPGYHPLTGEELVDLDAFDASCDALPNHGSSNGSSGTIEPGRYTTWTFNDPVHLNPGLYCVTGTVKMNAGGEIDGTGITIYYTGTDLTINGHAESELSAPNSEGGVSPTNGAIEDVLLYVPLTVNADIKINGNAGNVFGGTLWAPASYYKITGTSDSTNPTTMGVSLVGQTVWISGTSYLNLEYNEDKDAGWPAYLQLHE